MASKNSSHNTWRNIIAPPTPFLHPQVIPSWNEHFYTCCIFLFILRNFAWSPVLCSQSQPANGSKLDSLQMAIVSSWRDDPMLCMKVCGAVETGGPSSYPHNPHTPVPQTVCKQSEQPACLFSSRFTGHVSTLSSDLGLSTSSLSTIISVETSGRSLCSPASCPSCLTGVSHHESLIDQKVCFKANDLHFTCFLAAGKWETGKGGHCDLEKFQTCLFFPVSMELCAMYQVKC